MAAARDLWRLRPFLSNLSHKPGTGHDRFPPPASVASTQKLQLISRRSERSGLILCPCSLAKQNNKNICPNRRLLNFLIIGNTLVLRDRPHHGRQRLHECQLINGQITKQPPINGVEASLQRGWTHRNRLLVYGPLPLNVYHVANCVHLRLAFLKFSFNCSCPFHFQQRLA